MSLLGNLIRLVPLQLCELPYHVEFESSGTKGLVEQKQRLNSSIDDDASRISSLDPVKNLDESGRPKLALFLKEIVDEALKFVNDIVPSTFQEGAFKASKPAIAKVKPLNRNISCTELSKIPWSTFEIPRQISNGDLDSGEAWFARTSQHENRAGEGTASFEEFDWGLRVDHSEHEREYTPEIVDSYKVLDWDLETGADGLSIEKYSHIKMNSKCESVGSRGVCRRAF